MHDKLKKMVEYIRSNFVTVYLLLMFFYFPLYTRDMLYDVTVAKYLFVVKTTIFFAGCFLLLYFLKWDKICKDRFQKGDVLYVLFLLAGVISVCISDNRREAWNGEAGRHLGLLLYLIYGMAIVLVVTAEKINHIIFYGYAISTAAVSVLGVLNRYGIDPLHFYDEMVDDQKAVYISTIGNVDFFSVHLGVAFLFFAVLFLISNNTKELCIYGTAMTMAALGICSSIADSGYIAVFFYMITGWIVVKKEMQLFRYFFSICIFFSCEEVIKYLNMRSAPDVMDGIGIWIQNSICEIAIIIAAFFAVLVWAGTKIDAGWKNMFYRKAKCMLQIVVILLAAVMIILFFAVNFFYIGIAENGILSYLHITDEWGNGRGYVWRGSVSYYKQLPLIKKCFGIGPDRLISIFRSVGYDNAHNEFLQFLLTHGAIGTFFYFAWGIYSFYELVTDGKKQKYCIAVAMTTVGYALMMCFSVNTVHVTIIPLLLLCIGKRLSKKVFKE